MKKLEVEDYLFASAQASASFALGCLEAHNGTLRASSSFVTPEMEIMHWHEFGDLEGPGWAANAVGGAHLLFCWGRYINDTAIQNKALGLLDHILQDGFIHKKEGFIWPYYDLGKGRFCWNYTHGMDWLCPGSLAKIGVQLLDFSLDLSGTPRSLFMNQAAVNLGAWLAKNTPRLPNGWLPRRITPDGALFNLTPDGHADMIFDHSADGLFLLQLFARLAQLGHQEYRQAAVELAETYIRVGGWFGSINHDTYDDHESVAYASAFRVLTQVADALEIPAWRDFSYHIALPGLERYRMIRDLHGIPTAGLLWMETSWNTAYLWENAEAAHAYLQAWVETGDATSHAAGIEILNAIASHHHGEFGFLTEGVDWDNHVSRRHHVEGKLFEDIRYTEPLLNNLHVLGPTLYYLQRNHYQPDKIDMEKAINLVSELNREKRFAPAGRMGVRYLMRFYYPALENDERLVQALDFTRRSGADGVLLLEASYDMDPALLTIQQLQSRFERLKAIVPRFQEIVPEVHINVMVTIGHVDDGSARPERFPFQFLVNEYGKISRSSACPLDLNFLEHVSQEYHLAAETGAQVVWVDDDTRLLGHDLPGAACFCNRHLAALFQLTGQSWLRETLVEALKDDQKMELRQAWFDVQEEAFLNLARSIEQAVHSVNPGMRIGLMTVGQLMHAAEGRRTDRLLRTLAGEWRPLVRPGAGFWHDGVPGAVLQKVEGCARELSLVGEDILAVAEVENHPYTPFGKSNRILAMELSLNVLCGMPDISLNLLSSMGGKGPLEPAGTDYATLLQQRRPFLDSLAREWSGKRRQGISVLDHIDYARHARLDGKGLDNWLQPHPWEKMLAHLGFPLGKYDMGALGDDGPFLIAGEVIRAINDYDLAWYLRAGAILDATAAQELRRRGWGVRLGLRDIIPVGTGVNEVLSDDPFNTGFSGEILPIYNHVPPAQLNTWDLADGKGRVLSNWLDVDGLVRGPALVLLEASERVYSQAFTWKVMLLPFTLQTPAQALLSIPRRMQWSQALSWLSSRPLPCRVNRGVNIVPYAFKHPEQERWLFALVNMSADAQLVELALDGLKGRDWHFEHLGEDGDWYREEVACWTDPAWRLDLEAFTLAVLRGTK